MYLPHASSLFVINKTGCNSGHIHLEVSPIKFRGTYFWVTMHQLILQKTVTHWIFCYRRHILINDNGNFICRLPFVAITHHALAQYMQPVFKCCSHCQACEENLCTHMVISTCDNIYPDFMSKHLPCRNAVLHEVALAPSVCKLGALGWG